jgi:integrase
MPAENGLPQYVSKHARTGLYQYYRRPPTGVAGAAFARSFGSKDRKTVYQKYAAIHAEAEAYFERLISGRTVPDQDIDVLASSLMGPLRANPRGIMTRLDLDRFIAKHANDQVKALTGSDRKRLEDTVEFLYRHSEKVNLAALELRTEGQREYVTKRFGVKAVPAPVRSGLTLMGAYEQAWLPAATRSKNTAREVKRYVNDFIELNGDHDIKSLTREHWGKWRADCLERYGANWTAFKRFTMMKTIVTEAIKAGLMERKFFEGQDVVMRKPPRNKLRNEGWSDDELKTLFGSDLFRDREADPADYWIPVIIAHTGARLSEVAGMNVADVGQRHGMLTFYLAREEGKTEDSRRIIPIPKTITDLGFLEYLDTLPKHGPLFPRNTAYTFTKTFGRYRKRIGLKRKGCDLHAFRHHMKTLLGDLECPDRIND